MHLSVNITQFQLIIKKLNSAEPVFKQQDLQGIFVSVFCSCSNCFTNVQLSGFNEAENTVKRVPLVVISHMHELWFPRSANKRFSVLHLGLLFSLNCCFQLRCVTTGLLEN